MCGDQVNFHVSYLMPKSGESGAGKTESAKLIINHIIELCKSGSYGTNLEQQIVQVCLFAFHLTILHRSAPSWRHLEMPRLS